MQHKEQYMRLIGDYLLKRSVNCFVALSVVYDLHEVARGMAHLSSPDRSVIGADGSVMTKMGTNLVAWHRRPIMHIASPVEGLQVFCHNSKIVQNSRGKKSLPALSDSLERGH